MLDAWADEPPNLDDALLYNRRLWIILIDAVMRDENRLPIPVRQNILNIGVFVMAEIFSLMTKPKREHVVNLIDINRRIATGLQGSPKREDTPQAA